jgi:hypothetical protein
VESLSCFYNKKAKSFLQNVLEGRGPYQGLLVLHPLNERNIYANIKMLGKQNLAGSVTVIVA